jgi:hypothetical protein
VSLTEHGTPTATAWSADYEQFAAANGMALSKLAR